MTRRKFIHEDKYMISVVRARGSAVAPVTTTVYCDILNSKKTPDDR